MSKKIITSIVTVAFLIGPLFSGCDKAEETTRSQDPVKTFKVAKKEQEAEEKGLENAPEPPASGIIPVVGGVPNGDPAAGQPEVLSEKASDEMLYGKSSYDPSGRVDPFEPLFAKGGSGAGVTEGGEARPTIRQSRISRLTPLEKLDISQMKLVGIVSMPGRSMAMVEEAGGKGYVVRKGTYMGVNSGQVVEITRDRVVIEEEVENFLGKIVVRTRELKLQKPLGEE
ncbi:hypothetical protein DSLASN_35040 [Desulfoluna limicola]|uniref:Pilus assembly protein PilP n=1 Tax=Desulfoluna limicola TaxID=2810562 RepID=A0ABN6F681_9BACT|nr:pilus assembly protein PilP [Desulfoluna limicola]BCS97872.1 hypothetical protein DSLASN_35040 [Desulfoluna limicola]